MGSQLVFRVFIKISLVILRPKYVCLLLPGVFAKQNLSHINPNFSINCISNKIIMCYTITHTKPFNK